MASRGLCGICDGYFSDEEHCQCGANATRRELIQREFSEREIQEWRARHVKSASYARYGIASSKRIQEHK